MKKDLINPSHYKQGNIECIDVIKASMTHKEFCAYLKGQILRYLWRYEHKHKDPLNDLQKSQWYLNKLTEEVGNENK